MYLVYIIFIAVFSFHWKYQIKVLRLKAVGRLARNPHISHKTWKENEEKINFKNIEQGIHRKGTEDK